MQTLTSIFDRLSDPRYYQIAVLSVLLCYGIFALDFGIHWQNAIAIALTAQAVQYLASRLLALPRFDPLSAVITTLSLTLLLRTDSVTIAILAAALAIGSKFLLKFRGKHIFNPANFALVITMLASDHAWISTGQWGSAALGAFLLACLGFLVLTRARRAETTLGFLFVYGSLLALRALWLGDPMAIPLHQLQNGALLIFAFFMISDPKTSPNSATGRLLFSAIVALIAFTIQYIFYTPNGPVLALIIAAPLVPIVDLMLGGIRYSWKKPAARRVRLAKGV